MSDRLAALELNWQAQEQSRDIAEAIRQTGKLHPGVTTNFWLDFDGTRWFCFLQPDLSTASNKVTGSSRYYIGPPRLAIRQTIAHLFSLPVLTWEFSRVLQQTEIALPPYFTLSVELEGSPPIPLNTTTPSAGKPDGPIFAEAEGYLPLSETLDSESPPRDPFVQATFGHDASKFRTGESRRVLARMIELRQNRAVNIIEDPKPELTPHDQRRLRELATGASAGLPHYVLRMHLTDRNLMLAEHDKRIALFGALIVVSALAALIGFLAARRAFNRQLQLSDMKSNFVSSVSHELRAPIASVRLMAEGLERGAITEPSKQQQYFQFIVQECRRLSSLIENVLDFSRIEQGRKEYELASTDLLALTTQTVKLMDTYAAEQQIALALQTSGEPIPVELDGKAIQQALINLIDNAIKHSPKNATVTIGLDFPHATRNPQPIHLWVEDHGPGIPASEHEKLFERFYRLGSQLRRQTQGVGIGLSIVKHIIEAHGGHVHVRSALGEGSRFTLDLPAQNIAHE